jgi:hypothetical protein
MIMTGDSGLLDVPAAGGERLLLRFGCNGVVSPSGLSTSRVPMTLISGVFDVVIRSVPSGRLRRGLLWSPGVSFLRVITRGQISGLCLNKVFGDWGLGASARWLPASVCRFANERGTEPGFRPYARRSTQWCHELPRSHRALVGGVALDRLRCAWPAIRQGVAAACGLARAILPGGKRSFGRSFLKCEQPGAALQM